MRPSVSYTARIDLDEHTIVSLMSIRYSMDPPYCVSWAASVFNVSREDDGTVVYLSTTSEHSEHNYPCHIDAIEAGVNHYLRQASVERGICG